MSVTGGDFTAWAYDVRGRVLTESKQIPGAGQFVTSFTYNTGATNPIGRRVSMSVSGGDFTSWSYDARGRVLTESKQIPGGGQFVYLQFRRPASHDDLSR